MGQVLGGTEGPHHHSGGLDSGDLGFTQVADVTETQPHPDRLSKRILHRSSPPPPSASQVFDDVVGVGFDLLDGAVVGGGVDTRPQHHHPVALGVLDEGVGTVEAHRLGVEQPGQVLGRIVVSEPGRHVDDVGEAHRVALGETETGEPLELLPDLVGCPTGDPVGGHTRIDLVPEPGHGLGGALVGHGLAETVRLRAVESGADPSQLHELFLEDRHPQRPTEDRFGGGMRIPHRLLAVAPLQIGVDGLTLDGARSDQRHLDRQVVEGRRLHPGKGGHLGSGLDLEHPHRVGGGEHPVDLRLLGDRGQVEVDAVGLPDQVDAEVEGVEHAQPQEVELDHAYRCAVVLVPLDDGAPLHPPPFDGNHLPQGTVGDDHPTRMDPQVTGEPVESPADVVDRLGGESGW